MRAKPCAEANASVDRGHMTRKRWAHNPEGMSLDLSWRTKGAAAWGAMFGVRRSEGSAALSTNF